MYDQDSYPVAQKPRPRRRRGWVAGLLILVALIALFAWGANRRPKTYHKVGVYDLHMEVNALASFMGADDDMLFDRGIMPCLTGFCVREDAFVFTLHDWETGKPRWQVPTAVPYADPKKTQIAWTEEYHAAVSPDGHIFVAVSSDNDNLHVQTWRDGAAQGDLEIPLPPLLPPGFVGMPSSKQLDEVVDLRAAVTDAGRCFLILGWKLSPMPSRAFVIEGDRIVARYAGAEAIRQFSPDGMAMLFSSGKLARVAIEGKTLRFTDPLKLPIMDGVLLGAGGTAVTRDGTIYRLAGQPVTAKGFTCDTITANGRYAILYKDKVTRTVDLQTGSSWEIAVPQENDGGDATTDGRHILASFSGKPGGLTGLLRNMVGAQNHFIVLCERPGRQRAWMRIDRLQPTSWWPSPDGRAVAFTTFDKCLLYRW